MNRRETIILTMAALVASMAVLFAAKASRPAMPPQQAQPKKMSRAEQIERGKYLVTIGGCNDCHTPWIIQPDGKPGPDMSRSLSGHPQDFVIKQPLDLKSDRFDVAWAQPGTAFSGPWGVSFAANLTPDELTGTGIWTFDTFKNTIRRGRHWGVSRELLPPMPWFNYRHMTDEDLEAVWVYTRTLKPIRNQVPDPIPPAHIAP